MWVEIDRKDIKVGYIISHNEHAEYKVTRIEGGLIHTTPGSFFYIERHIGFDGPLFRLVEAPKEFKGASDRRVTIDEEGEYEFYSLLGGKWMPVFKSAGDHFYQDYRYRKVATPEAPEAPEEEAPKELEEFEVAVTRLVEPHEYGDYEYLYCESGWGPISKSQGDKFYAEITYRKVATPEAPKEFKIANTRLVDPREYGNYEYQSSVSDVWEKTSFKSEGSHFLKTLTYRKVATPAPEEEAPTFESQVDAVLKEVKTLLLEKNLKYGNSALEPVRIFSKADPSEQIRVRLDDKLSRIRNGADNEDPIKDLMGYLVLLKIKEGGK